MTTDSTPIASTPPTVAAVTREICRMLLSQADALKLPTVHTGASAAVC